MKSFHFPLERVLAWRRAELEAQHMRLGALIAEQQRLEAARAKVVNARPAAQRRLLGAAQLDGIDLAALAAYHRRLQTEKEEIERRTAGCRERIAAQQKSLTAAHRRVRLLEKLRERRLTEWRDEWNRETENFASEAHLTRWSTARRGRSVSEPA